MKLILWQIIKSCEAFKCDFTVDHPLEQTRHILDGITAKLEEDFFPQMPPERSRTLPEGFKYNTEERESTILYPNLLRLRVGHFKIGHFLMSRPGNPANNLLLNSDAFPTADVMNYGPVHLR